MLLVATKTLAHDVELPTRTPLLEKLQEKGLMPLVRSARLHAYEVALLGAERTSELERAVAAQADAEGEAPYVRGDLFCFEDFVHFLIFADGGAPTAQLRAGIVYEPDTPDPRGKLDAFCRNVFDALEAARGFSNLKAAGALLEVQWQEPDADAPEGFARFAAEGAQESTRNAVVADWLHVAGMLENTEARHILRRLVEAQREGRTGAGVVGLEREGVAESLLERLAGVGLIKRQVLVSCRKDGRSLFRLPSADALHVLNASNAVCSECGASIADEKADEITVPTSLTTTLLQDGSWLTTHLRSILVGLGVPEAQIETRPVSGEGESRAMAHLCGETFLFLLRDGDWTGADARRSVEEQARTDAAHLVIIATGKIQDEARQRLREHARRRAHGRTGAPDALFIEGMETVAPELQQAFERVALGALNDELWPLDAGLGLNAAQLVAARFRLLQHTGALRELAASAAGALAGSLREV
ncbi:MAG TPA: hypothetical protein VF546_00360 [Pyrinomonadaceae bacterium]|jgi:hypothetical protein